METKLNHYSDLDECCANLALSDLKTQKKSPNLLINSARVSHVFHLPTIQNTKGGRAKNHQRQKKAMREQVGELMKKKPKNYSCFFVSFLAFDFIWSISQLNMCLNNGLMMPLARPLDD